MRRDVDNLGIPIGRLSKGYPGVFRRNCTSFYTSLSTALEWGMNYLAHIYLARHSDAAMVGGHAGRFRQDERRGFTMRRRLRTRSRCTDSSTRSRDSHPVVTEAKSLFTEGRRRLCRYRAGRVLRP
ncbi:ACP phosphodiesterase [Massilia eburnea]|uniref:ACP phosphodiesterase n=1 Tax=Massilia eburnea TaxID=1776165 RepID=UPI003D6B5E87